MNDTLESAASRTKDEQDRVIHEVDGIGEYDNQLPRWWLYTLYGTIAFAAVYYWVYQTAHVADLPGQAYQAELDRAAAAEAERVKAAGVMTPEALVTLSRDKTTVEQGKAVFAQTCAACHRADGGGNVGPNLTDGFWLHGGAPEEIWKTVSEGVPDKGMPSWRPMIGADKVQAVTAYVLTIRNTDVPGGKPPQGVRQAAR